MPKVLGIGSETANFCLAKLDRPDVSGDVISVFVGRSQSNGKPLTADIAFCLATLALLAATTRCSPKDGADVRLWSAKSKHRGNLPIC